MQGIPPLPPQRTATGIKAGLIIGGVAGLILITTTFGSWYTVDQTQRGVLLRNGAFESVVQPGLNFKFPWIESVYKIDMQTHTKTWDKMQSYSKDQQPADIRVSVTYHVSPDKVEEIYNRFAGDNEAAITRLVGPHVYEKVKNVFGQFTAANAISERAKLNTDISVALKEALAYDPIFIIDSVQIEDISFSPDYIRSVEDRMRAEVEVLKLQQNLAREKVQADIAFTQADGRARAIRTEAQAQADAIRLRGDAEAASIEARGKSLKNNQDIVELTKADRWNGVLPTTMVPAGAVPFMSVK
jgi:regulator of protease activity HflC (stomatin/prohibitin superfamily)